MQCTAAGKAQASGRLAGAAGILAIVALGAGYLPALLLEELQHPARVPSMEHDQLAACSLLIHPTLVHRTEHSVHAIVWLLAASGVVQQPQAMPAPPDSTRAAAVAAESAAPIGPVLPPTFLDARHTLVGDSARGPQRPRVIEYTHAYDVRLTIHHYASYATLPLFAAEFVLGQNLYNNPPGSSSTLQAHRLVALGVAGLFGVNTITGAWNLWDSRKNPEGRLKRWIHASLMIASDAGFVATGATAPGRRRLATDPGAARAHRTIAIASIGTALAGYGIMLLWKD